MLTPVTLVRRDWSLLEELLPLLRQSREREQSIFGIAATDVSLAIGDGHKNCVGRARGFDSEGSWSGNGIGSGEGLELTVIVASLVGFLQCSGQSRGQVSPWVRRVSVLHRGVTVGVGCLLLLCARRHLEQLRYSHNKICREMIEQR